MNKFIVGFSLRSSAGERTSPLERSSSQALIQSIESGKNRLERFFVRTECLPADARHPRLGEQIMITSLAEYSDAILIISMDEGAHGVVVSDTAFDPETNARISLRLEDDWNLAAYRASCSRAGVFTQVKPAIAGSPANDIAAGILKKKIEDPERFGGIAFVPVSIPLTPECFSSEAQESAYRTAKKTVMKRSEIIFALNQLLLCQKQKERRREPSSEASPAAAM